jgi:hypothetical protein
MIMKKTAERWRRMSTDERALYEELTTQEKERKGGVLDHSDTKICEEPTALILPTEEIKGIEEESETLFTPSNTWTAINSPLSELDSTIPPIIDEPTQLLPDFALSDQQMLIGISSTFFSMMETENEATRTHVYTVSVLKLPLGIYREHQESPIHFYSSMTAANNYLRHVCE